MKKYVFLYAGQGSQKEGMGKDFYESYETYRKVIDSLSGTVQGKSVKTWMEEGTLEELSKTELTQPCMSAFAAGVTAVLAEKGILPAAACGLSLGEYGALHAAGVFDADTYVNITAHRGQYMADASSIADFKMCAVLATPIETIEAVCEECLSVGFVKTVNYNCPGQYVIGGEEKAVEEAEKRLKEQGAKRIVPLKVSGPFHTKFMQPAAEKLEQYLENISFEEPKIPVAFNCLGSFKKEEDSIKSLLKTQIQSSVYFEQNIKTFLEEGYDQFLEIGPGNTLSAFVKKTAAGLGKKVSIISIDKAEDLAKLEE